MREQDRTLECGHSIYRFHKQVNLGERTWNDDLHAMSYSFGIAIVVLVAEQDVILQKSLFTAGMLCSQQPCVWTQSTYGTFILQSGRRPQHHIRSLTNVRRTTALPSRADVA